MIEGVHSSGAGRFRIAKFVRSRPMTAWAVFVLAGYAAVCVLSLTTSSVAVELLRTDPDRGTGLLAGRPLPVRSDEFLRATPWTLGRYRDPDGSFGTPLGYPDPAVVAPGEGGPLTKLLYVDTTATVAMGRTEPGPAYAFGWWLGTVLCVLLVPVWLRLFGVRPAFGIAAALLVFFAPVSAWWSWAPMMVIALALLAGISAQRMHASLLRDDWLGVVAATGWMIVGGLAFARLVLSYQPWSIPIALGILVPTLVIMLRGERRWLAALSVAGVVTWGAIAVSAYMNEHSGSLQVLTDTVYPGSRRSMGTALAPELLFGAPHLWFLQLNPPLTGLNQSESSSGYFVLGLVALILGPWLRMARADDPDRPATPWGRVAMGAVLLVLATWILVDWPVAATQMYPANLVQPKRLAQVIGLLSTLYFAITLSELSSSHIRYVRPLATLAALIVAIATGWAGSLFRQSNATTYRPLWILLVAALAGLATYVAIRWCRRPWALVPMVVMAFPVVALANPIQQGLGDLIDSSAARSIRANGKELGKDGRWANDDITVDGLLMANAQPSLSGQMWVGPDAETWKILDPDGSDRESWNRGAAYVVFSWEPEGTKTSIALPGADLVQVRADPCGPDMQALDLRLVITGAELTNSCLTQIDQFNFGGNPRRIYRVEGV